MTKPRSLVYFAAALLAATLAGPAAAQQARAPITLETPIPAGVTYDDAIPTPEEVLGYTIGERHTTPLEVALYFRAVADASPRVTLVEKGRTYGNRPLIHAIVTTPENHARLDAIHAANARLSSAEAGEVTDAELAGMPVVAHMNYSIHGNEASGTEAGILLLYHLAAGRGAPVESVLENVITILDPMLNPDGRDRFADWVNSNRGAIPVSDPQNREHDEPWPGGRTNHYWFDLNRDWLPLVHPESQARVALYHHWRPQLLTDYHEMGSSATYFFMPGEPSRTNPFTPDINQELTAEIAEYHARYLDEIGSLYYTEEGYDDYYYGKGSSFPDAQGTVGILFEQASSRALERETQNGVLTYAFTVRNQFLASLSTLHAAVELRDALLRYQRDFYAGAGEWARQHPVKGYVISLERDRTRAQALARLLQDHRIDVHGLTRDMEVDGTRFRAGEAYVVPVDQPQARFIAAIMEPVSEFPDSIFYDVSTWTLPLAYGVEYAELERSPGNALGPVLPPVVPDGGELVGGTASYAYLLEWDRYFAPRALHRLQSAGVLARLMSAPFTSVVAGQATEFGPGTIVIPVTQPDVDAETVHDLVREAVREDHVRIHATATGLTPAGYDLGSRSADVLERPEMALVVGSGASSYEAGHAWYILSERFRFPVTLLEVDDVDEDALRRYNTLVLAGGSYGGMDAEAVTDWVRDGGRLVGLHDAAEWLVRNELLDAEPVDADLEGRFDDVAWIDLSDAYGAQVLGGAILGIELDETHPLAFGYDGVVPVFRQDEHAFRGTGGPGTVVGRYAEQPVLSGYVSGPRRAQLAGTDAVLAQGMGSGSVIALLDQPNFRGFWWGTTGLFMNAIFFGDAF